MNIKNHIWDIYCISREHSVQKDVALDMFTANLNSHFNRYPGANHVDYETLGAAWAEMTAAEKRAQRSIFLRITEDYFKQLSFAWQTQDKEKFDAIVAGAQ